MASNIMQVQVEIPVHLNLATLWSEWRTAKFWHTIEMFLAFKVA